MTKTVLICWLVLLFSTIGYLFWHNEWKYSLPTPVPQNYKTIIPGTVICTSKPVKKTNGKPVFLHFFNPDCPCSRFNIPQFKSLVKQYGNDITFKVVVLSNNTTYTAEDIQDKFGLALPVSFDT